MAKPLLYLALVTALAAAGWFGLHAWIDREVNLRLTANAAEVTNATLDRLTDDLAHIRQGTERLNQDMGGLAQDTKSTLSRMRKELANAKTANLADPLPDAVAASICVQFHKANSGNALHGKALPDSLLRLPEDAFATRCRNAWRKVTWGSVVEWLVPLMEYGGKLQRMLDAGRDYYSPKAGNK